jgi:hypothetical protein
MLKRDWLFLLIMVPSTVVLAWPVLIWLHRLLWRISGLFVDWLLAEKHSSPPKSTAKPPANRACPCACCGHRRSAHENGADNCVADGCDCRGFVPRRGRHPHA